MRTVRGNPVDFVDPEATDKGKINQLVLVSEEEISSVLYENIIGNGCNGAGPCPMYMADSG